MVIKSFNPSSSSKEMVEHEWKMINHPAVGLGAGDVSIDPETDYFLLPMKYIPGETFRKAFDKFKINHAQVMPTWIKVNRLLDRLHASGLVHSDPAPRNVILRNNNPLDPILIDYGRAFESRDPLQFTQDKKRLQSELKNAQMI